MELHYDGWYQYAVCQKAVFDKATLDRTPHEAYSSVEGGQR